MKSYAQNAAAGLGLHPRTISRHVRRAEKIAEDVKKEIKGTRWDTGVELDALADMSHDEQRKAVHKIFETGKAHSFRQVIQRDRRRATERLRDINEVAERLTSYLWSLLDPDSHKEIRELEEIVEFAKQLDGQSYEELIPAFEEIERRAKTYREQLIKARGEHVGPIINQENYSLESDASNLPKQG